MVVDHTDDDAFHYYLDFDILSLVCVFTVFMDIHCFHLFSCLADHSGKLGILWTWMAFPLTDVFSASSRCSHFPSPGSTRWVEGSSSRWEWTFLRCGAWNCTCPVDLNSSSNILVVKCHSGCCCVVLWLIRVLQVAQHLCLQHARIFSGLPALSSWLYILPCERRLLGSNPRGRAYNAALYYMVDVIGTWGISYCR